MMASLRERGCEAENARRDSARPRARGLTNADRDVSLNAIDLQITSARIGDQVAGVWDDPAALELAVSQRWAAHRPCTKASSAAR